MSFLDSYKRLEKLCGEILNDDRRISAYIDEMLKMPRGAYLVTGWEDDLKQLKRYRWIRNQIVHDPACREENMCTYEDQLWIDGFYARIMEQTDPLTRYRKITEPRKTTLAKETTNPCGQEKMEWNDNRCTESQHSESNTMTIMIAIAIVTVAVTAMAICLLLH